MEYKKCDKCGEYGYTPCNCKPFTIYFPDYLGEEKEQTKVESQRNLTTPLLYQLTIFQKKLKPGSELMKIETPEEFVSRVNGMAYDDEVATVAARDTAIRADERQKAAEIEKAAYKRGFSDAMSSNYERINEILGLAKTPEEAI